MHALVFCGEQNDAANATAAAAAAAARPVAFTSQAPRPTLLRPRDAIVRVTCAGVCGSDLHCAWHCLEKGLTNGTVVGHEAVGTVVALGAEAAAASAPPSALALGARVLIPFTASCGACASCQRGDTNRCRSSRLFGWRSGSTADDEKAEPQLHGCQAQFVRVPFADSTLLPLPGRAPDELGVLLGDILSTAFFCARQGGITPSTRTVAVVGCGPVGLLAILAAKHESKGKARVVAVDGVPERRAMALEAMGADAAVSPGDLAGARRALGTEEEGADVVLELVGGDSGRPDGPLRLAFDLLRPAGVLASQGVHTGDAWPWTPVEAYDKNLTFKAGRCPARRVAAELIEELFGAGGGEEGAEAEEEAKRRLVERALRVFTHRLPMSQGAEGYEMFAARRDGCVKVALDPWR
jgi:threonine dehydrogenase-like Zn-dependent dehydrogenase